MGPLGAMTNQSWNKSKLGGSSKQASFKAMELPKRSGEVNPGLSLVGDMGVCCLVTSYFSKGLHLVSVKILCMFSENSILPWACLSKFLYFSIDRKFLKNKNVCQKT